MKEKMVSLLPGFSILKYGSSLILTLLAVSGSGMWGGLVAALAELAAIFCISNMILRHSRMYGWVANGLLLFLYNAQMLVKVFGGTFISLIMISNLDSLEDLGGKIVIYGFGVIFTVIVSVLPTSTVLLRRFSWSGILAAVLAVELVFTLACGNENSPLYAYHILGEDMMNANALKASVRDAKEDMTMHFWSYSDYNFRKKPENLPEKPNVIIIMTEGLSNNIIYDDREIMPNVAAYKEKSLSFEHYFNHTFATYRGIIGQLYSGYQLDNYDTNSLVSLQEAFRKNGYYTSIINTEPTNLTFATYLENLGFDETITNTSVQAGGTADSLSDLQAYETLFDEACKYHGAGKPFMTTIYTFGTHVSLNSPDEKFGDGSNRLLNRFYNTDFQFGKFMEKFEESELAEDTIVVFTADHCTFVDSDFRSTFPGVLRLHPECDEMPLFIYYRGIEPEIIDVDGRNTLDFTPTILDYLDMFVGNYFLGFSLFGSNEVAANMTSFDRIFSDSNSHVSTSNGQISELSDVQREVFETEVERYYIAASQPRAK